MRKRLRKRADAVVALIDEIGISENTAESSLNFARDVRNAGGGANDLNILVVLFVIRSQASEFLGRPSAPRAPRRYELEDFGAPDIQTLLVTALSPQRITCDPAVANHVLRLTGGRPDVTMALLVDTWDGITGIKTRTTEDVVNAVQCESDIATLTVLDVDRAAHQGKETLERVEYALAEIRALANANLTMKPVLLALAGLTSFGEEVYPRDEWQTAVRKAAGATPKTDKAFAQLWDALQRWHVIREVSADRWEFRGRLMRTSLQRLAL